MPARFLSAARVAAHFNQEGTWKTVKRDPRSQGDAGAAVAIIGVLAAANRTSVVLKALGEAMPQLAATLPTVLTACGAIVAALSQPPDLTKR